MIGQKGVPISDWLVGVIEADARVLLFEQQAFLLANGRGRKGNDWFRGVFW